MIHVSYWYKNDIMLFYCFEQSITIVLYNIIGAMNYIHTRYNYVMSKFLVQLHRLLFYNNLIRPQHYNPCFI